MQPFNAASYHDAVTHLERIATKVEGYDGAQQVRMMNQDEANVTLSMLKKVESAMQPLNVPVSKLTFEEIKEILSDCKNNRIQFIGLGQLLMNLSSNLKRELQVVKAFTLDAATTGFYTPAEPPFGAEVAAKFGSIAGELDQAGKCFACDLPTAAAFHWVRCLEAGIRAVSRCLGIPDPTKGSQRNWSSIAREIANAIDKKWPTAIDKDTAEAKRFAKYLACLTAFTNPYRNETMHFDAVYTSSEARHLYELVKGLMTQIAARMDEDGAPVVP